MVLVALVISQGAGGAGRRGHVCHAGPLGPHGRTVEPHGLLHHVVVGGGGDGAFRGHAQMVPHRCGGSGVAQDRVGEGGGRSVPPLDDRALGARRVRLLLIHHHTAGGLLLRPELVRGRSSAWAAGLP